MNKANRKTRTISMITVGLLLYGVAPGLARADTLGEAVRLVFEGNQAVANRTDPPLNSCQNQAPPSSTEPAVDPATAVQTITSLATQYPACSKYSWKKR
ncbi:MAG: hypothetical protein KGQ59_10265, partial [Bdellovibrionales bacterium]|nr:hypothetical protein [Bdellovibrionales bacterium]